MAKYLIQVHYTADGVKGLLADGGTARRAASEKAIESVGGKMEAFYFALGDVDAYVIADLPDDASVVALELASKVAVPFALASETLVAEATR